MRRRYIAVGNKWVEVTPGMPSNARRTDPILGSDRLYDGLRATDGSDIGSYSKHREYMRTHNLTTMDDFKETWAKKAEERANYYQGKPGSGSVSRQDVARAIHELEGGKRSK